MVSSYPDPEIIEWPLFEDPLNKSGKWTYYTEAAALPKGRGTLGKFNALGKVHCLIKFFMGNFFLNTHKKE